MIIYGQLNIVLAADVDSLPPVLMNFRVEQLCS
jgi:hypothetical protein